MVHSFRHTLDSNCKVCGNIFHSSRYFILSVWHWEHKSRSTSYSIASYYFIEVVPFMPFDCPSKKGLWTLRNSQTRHKMCMLECFILKLWVEFHFKSWQWSSVCTLQGHKQAAVLWVQIFCLIPYAGIWGITVVCSVKKINSGHWVTHFICHVTCNSI